MELVCAQKACSSSQPPTSSDRAEQPLVFVAGFWQRTLAAFIDGLILSPLFLLLGWLGFGLAGLPNPLGAGGRLENIFELLIDGGSWFYGLLGMAALLVIFYGFFFTVISGATVGQRWCGLRVIDLYGVIPSWQRALLRSLGMMLNYLTLGLGFVWTAVDPHKRGLHDWLAGTYVIRRPPTSVEEDAR